MVPKELKTDDGEKGHATQKPEALLYRVLTASTQPGDIILDPFFGSGTTGAVAKKLGRNFIGIEREDSYIKLAKKRIAAAEQISEESLQGMVAKREELRVPFGWLIERGLIKPGATLTDSKNSIEAKVTADGSVVTTDGVNQYRGSIHKVGAAIQSAPSCNGWTYWHYNDGKNSFPIDRLRQRVREEMNVNTVMQ